MLKFTYSETGICLEQLSQSVEHVISQRTLLAVRTQSRILVEPCSASFLLPTDLDQLQALQQLVERNQTEWAIALSAADTEYVEVSVQGLWLCSEPETVEGVFILSLTAELEALIAELWHISQFCIPTVPG